MGIDLGRRSGGTAAILIPSVGCPLGCNFCSTSALFGGKGNFVDFFATGDELFRVMSEIEAELKTRSFFVLDENFLHHKKRALRLLELMEEHDRNWALYVFSSARVLESYSLDQLVRLGISWVWMGLEGKESAYDKLRGVDTRALVALLQSHGIRVLGSTIIGLEDHRPEGMDDVIAHAVSHATVFHQFMLYTPLPGTPLHERHRQDGSLIPEAEFPPADAHGQYRFNYTHRHITDGREEGYLREAFRRDFAQNGPSILRMIRVLLNGWQRYRMDPRDRIRSRIAREAAPLRTTYAGAVWAIRKWYRADPPLRAAADALLYDITAAFGWPTRLLAPLIGRYAFSALQKETARLASGWRYEPPTLYERNAAALARERERSPQPSPLRLPVSPPAEASAVGIGK